MMDGCLAVNFIGNHNIRCELTTGLNNETEMQDDHNSELLVLGKTILELFYSISVLMFLGGIKGLLKHPAQSSENPYHFDGIRKYI